MTRKTDYLALVNQATDLISVLNSEGNYLFLNESHTGIMGSDLSLFMGKSIFNQIHPADRAGFQASFSLLQTQNKIQFALFRMKSCSGNWQSIKAHAVNFSHDPGIGGIVLVSQDVTELVSAKQQLARAQQRDSALANATGAAIFDWDICADKLEWVSGFYENFGYAATQSNIYEFYSKIYSPDQRRIWHEIEDGIGSSLVTMIGSKFRFRKANGALADVDYFGIFLQNENGKVHRAVGALRNLSELESHLQRVRRKNVIMKEIAWSESHIVRSPLLKMLNIIELMETNPDVQPNIKDLIKIVSQLANEFNNNIRYIGDR